MFSPFLTQISQSQAFQVYFIVECSQSPNLAAGHLQALQHKPSRQVAVVCDCFGQFQNHTEAVWFYHIYIYVSKCSASIQIPHIQTVLTKHIEVAALGRKMWQFINCFLQSYMLLIFLFS